MASDIIYMLKCTTCGDPFSSMMKEPIYQLCDTCLDDWRNDLRGGQPEKVVMPSEMANKHYQKFKPDIMSGGQSRKEYVEARLRQLDPKIEYSIIPLMHGISVYAKNMGVSTHELASVLVDQHLRWRSVSNALNMVAMEQATMIGRMMYEAEMGAEAFLATEDGAAFYEYIKGLCCYVEGPKDDDDDSDKFAQIG
jgi:hypothetical protein